MGHANWCGPEGVVYPEVITCASCEQVLGDRADGKGIASVYLQRFGAKLEDKRTTFGMMVGVVCACAQRDGSTHSHYPFTSCSSVA